MSCNSQDKWRSLAKSKLNSLLEVFIVFRRSTAQYHQVGQWAVEYDHDSAKTARH